MTLDSKNVIIFTDGSSRGNPGPGGWGAVIVYNDGEFKVESRKLKVQELGSREEHTTNNRMELQAVIGALSFFSDFTLYTLHFQLFSDSSYLVNGITKWIHGWKKNGWKTKAKEPVENQDLWERLDKVTSGKKIEWKLIGGHIGLAGNERCDEIATAFADLPAKILQGQNLGGRAPELYTGPIENYPIKNILDIKIDKEMAEKKSESRNHSKAKAYSYVSMIDGEIKTHKTWAECEARVKGKKARYKKAISAEDEKEIKNSFSAV